MNCSLKKVAGWINLCCDFYGWDRKSASIGYIQKFSAVEDQSYTVVRRPTGGGVVFHDVDLTYTVAVPKGHYIEKT